MNICDKMNRDKLIHELFNTLGVAHDAAPGSRLRYMSNRTLAIISALGFDNHYIYDVNCRMQESPELKFDERIPIVERALRGHTIEPRGDIDPDVAHMILYHVTHIHLEKDATIRRALILKMLAANANADIPNVRVKTKASIEIQKFIDDADTTTEERDKARHAIQKMFGLIGTDIIYRQMRAKI